MGLKKKLVKFAHSLASKKDGNCGEFKYYNKNSLLFLRDNLLKVEFEDIIEPFTKYEHESLVSIFLSSLDDRDPKIQLKAAELLIFSLDEYKLEFSLNMAGQICKSISTHLENLNLTETLENCKNQLNYLKSINKMKDHKSELMMVHEYRKSYQAITRARIRNISLFEENTPTKTSLPITYQRDECDSDIDLDIPVSSTIKVKIDNDSEKIISENSQPNYSEDECGSKSSYAKEIIKFDIVEYYKNRRERSEDSEYDTCSVLSSSQESEILMAEFETDDIYRDMRMTLDIDNSQIKDTPFDIHIEDDMGSCFASELSDLSENETIDVGQNIAECTEIICDEMADPSARGDGHVDTPEPEVLNSESIMQDIINNREMSKIEFPSFFGDAKIMGNVVDTEILENRIENDTSLKSASSVNLSEESIEEDLNKKKYEEKTFRVLDSINVLKLTHSGNIRVSREEKEYSKVIFLNRLKEFNIKQVLEFEDFIEETFENKA